MCRRGLPRLLQVRFGLRVGVRTVEKKSYNFFEHFLPRVDGAVDAVARLRPVHFARRYLPRQGFLTLAELDAQLVPAQHHRDTMMRIAMPGCCFSRREKLPPHQVIATMKQYLLLS